MKRILFAAALMMLAFVSGHAELMALPVTPTVSQDSSPVVQKITITGIVPYMRLIYVDPQQHILRVVGNTDQNIDPEVVLSGNNQKLSMSSYINEQYQRILSAHNGRLEAGKTYYPAPSELNPQTLQPNKEVSTQPAVGLSALKLSFG